MNFEIIDMYVTFGPWPTMRAESPASKLSAVLKEQNVKQGLAISSLGILHNHIDGNNDTLRVCQSDPLLTPVATIDPRGYFGRDGYPAKLAEQGFKMFRFFPQLQEWTPENYAFAEALDEVCETGLPVMIRAMKIGDPSTIARKAAGKNNYFILEGVTYDNMAETMAVMRKHENILVDTRGLKVPAALKFLVDKIGADRIVFASGTLTESLAAEINYVLNAEIDDAAREKIFSGNAKRVIGGL